MAITSVVAEVGEDLKPDAALQRIAAMPPAAAQMHLAKIQLPGSEAATALADPRHPYRQQMLKEWTALHQRAKPGVTITPAASEAAVQAMRWIERIESDPETQAILRDRGHRQHASLVADLGMWYRQAYPEPAAG